MSDTRAATPSRHARFLIDVEGFVVFILVVDDDRRSANIDVYEVDIVPLDEVLFSMKDWLWVGALGVEPYGSFFIKSDGCSHWQSGMTWAKAEAGSDRPYRGQVHLCGRGGWVQHLALMEHVYSFATTHVDKFLDDEAEPIRSAWSETLTLVPDSVPVPVRP